MKLIPVVDFLPTYFQTQEHEMPESSLANAGNEWHRYWKESLADSGITNLEPYETGSWLVEVAKLSPPVIEILLSKAYSLDNQATDTNKFRALEGGYILEVSTTVQIMPQCCGTLQDISEWKTASNWTNVEEMMLWIGHPWLMISANDEQLQIKRTAEYGETEEPVTIAVERNALRAAIVETENSLEEFYRMLLEILPHFPAEVVKQLIHGC